MGRTTNRFVKRPGGGVDPGVFFILLCPVSFGFFAVAASAAVVMIISGAAAVRFAYCVPGLIVRVLLLLFCETSLVAVL